MNTMGILTSLSIFRMLVLRNKVSMVPKILVKISPVLQGSSSSLSMRQWAVTMVFCTWVWSVGLAMPPLIGWGQYAPEENGMR